MEFIYLRYFQAVAQHEHISKAAEELHITQPALSRAISRLEREVGAPLFVREPNRIHLNHAGRTMLLRVEQILSQYDDAMREIQDSTSADNGSVMVLTASEDLFSDCFTQHMLRHPRLQMFHRIINEEEMIRVLESRAGDFAICSEMSGSVNITWKPIFTERYVLAVAKTNPLSRRESVAMEELSDCYFISMLGGTIFDTHLRNLSLQTGYDPKIRFKGVDSDLPWELLKNDLGVMLLPASALYRKNYSTFEQRREDLSFLKIQDPACSRTVGIAVYRGGYLSKAATAAIESVYAYYEEMRGNRGITLHY